MSHVSSPDLVRGADRHAVACLGAKVALLLDNDYDAVAWGTSTPKPLLAGAVLDIPTFAGRFERSTLTHSTMAAPELSMQLTRV